MRRLLNHIMVNMRSSKCFSGDGFKMSKMGFSRLALISSSFVLNRIFWKYIIFNFYSNFLMNSMNLKFNWNILIWNTCLWYSRRKNWTEVSKKEKKETYLFFSNTFLIVQRWHCCRRLRRYYYWCRHLKVLSARPPATLVTKNSKTWNDGFGCSCPSKEGGREIKQKGSKTHTRMKANSCHTAKAHWCQSGNNARSSPFKNSDTHMYNEDCMKQIQS